jgi:hypothetical protein
METSSDLPNPQNGGGHRSIALLSQMGKILERGVNWKAEQVLQVATDQFGCRNSVAVDLVIYKFYNVSILQEGELGLAVFVDLKKAFARVIRSQILEKLIDDEPPPWIIFFFHDFLSNRSFKVRYRGELSEEHSSFSSAHQTFQMEGKPKIAFLWTTTRS